MPQQQRDAFFLTEMCNVRSLIRHQGATGEQLDLGLRTSLLRSLSPNGPGLGPTQNSGQKQGQGQGQGQAPEEGKAGSGASLEFESRFESGNLCLAVKVRA